MTSSPSNSLSPFSVAVKALLQCSFEDKSHLFVSYLILSVSLGESKRVPLVRLTVDSNALFSAVLIIKMAVP